MPRGTGVSNPTETYFLKKERLVGRLNLKIEKYTEELSRVEDILERIEDAEIRAIARMRFIQCLKWEEIAERVHLERTTCAKKLKRYINSMEIQ
nr:MAG TPA: Protein of unknown function (DUF1492) [Caudoviricetes sp.]